MFMMIEYIEWVSDTDRFSWLGNVDQTTTYIEGDEMDEHFDLEAVEGQGTRSSIQGLVSKGIWFLIY